MEAWEALTVDEVTALFADADFRWWFAGGHALELHLGGVSWRDHDDIDISVCRDDAAALFTLLGDWDLHVAARGVLTEWDGDALDAALDQNNVWCRSNPGEPWVLDVVISDGDATDWIYRRDPRVRVPWKEALRTRNGGPPYLAPELQLLFKSADARPKDNKDAGVIVPALPPPTATWLANQLDGDHPWQLLFGERIAADVAIKLGMNSFLDQLASGRSSHAWRVTESERDTVIRTPIANSGRRITYHAEALIGDLLAAQGAPVATWQLVETNGVTSSVGEFIPGERLLYGDQWTPRFGAELAATLHAVHNLPVSGFGPLDNAADELRGISQSRRQGMVDRWYHAPIWPFDGSSLADHVLQDINPTAAAIAWSYHDDIIEAASGPTGLVHSDLHREHLLVGEDGELTGVLDFGDAFVGALAWDFALLHWYYGKANAELVADAYPGGEHVSVDGETLAIAVGLYKLMRNPAAHAFVLDNLLGRLSAA